MNYTMVKMITKTTKKKKESKLMVRPS